MKAPASEAQSSHHTTVRLDWRIVAGVLFAIILGMLYMWKPWQPSAARTITVRGEATVEAVPDSFQFQPVYQHDDAQKVTATGNAVVARLKELGVKPTNIKTTASAAPKIQDSPARSLAPEYYSPKSTFTIIVTVANKDLAQKIADYLATTGATGQVTPTATFSKTAREKLDLQARREAGADAKQKGEAMAEQFSAHLGRVTKISEEGNVGIYALDSRGATEATKPQAGPIVEPGANELTYAFNVVFELK